MKTEDEVKLNSYFQAQKDIEKLFEVSEMLRQRTHSMSEKISLNSYMIKDNAANLLEAIKSVKESREILDKLNVEMYSRRTIIELINDILTSPKKIILLCIGISFVEIFIGLPDIIKHFIGW